MEDQKEYNPSEDQLLQTLFDLIVRNYEPCESISELSQFLTTEDITEKLQEVYPSVFYGGHAVATLLFEAGFKVAQLTTFTFVWLLRPK